MTLPRWLIFSPQASGLGPSTAIQRSFLVLIIITHNIPDSTMISPSVAYQQQAVDMVPGLPLNTYSVLATASARVYHAQNLKGSGWCYSRLKGTLVFGKNIMASVPVDAAENHWFRLLDENSGKAVWIFQIPSGLAYQQDRPFFHVFQGRVSANLVDQYSCIYHNVI